MSAEVAAGSGDQAAPEPGLASAEDVARALDQRKREHFARLASKGWARSQPVASDIEPTSCLRRQVLEIVAWQAKEPFSPEAQERMDWGDEAERAGLTLLTEKLRLRVIRQQDMFELRHRKTGELVLRGKFDGIVEMVGADGRRVRSLLEIKKVGPWVMDKLTTAADFTHYWWTRKYLSQMQAYLIGEGLEWGVFLVTDGSRWAFLPVALDYEHAEAVWAHAEAVVDAVRAYRESERRSSTGTELPPFTEDREQCRHCGFFGRGCNPPLVELGADLLTDPQLEADLRLREESKDAHRQYEAADKRVKDLLKPAAEAGLTRAICGDFVIEVKTQNLKPQPPKPATPGGVRRVIHIERAGAAGPAEEA